ncbi:cell wall metabolism sensor histidine kinase WalK [Nocardioides sp. zg-DK7169]|uniref:sensor histidine kinase n=1 Tax=Nocardioides sp. zg-DK7169 TaxID=2736600 RepID=UPI00155665B5|nr:HAMP domain-containing sensor histidine kinase [Nocardioides sp. zg-DK7169]NPC96918.1 HAMP domain-containing histidine kinase [Nocardioides sp. zg-DK7169]
MTTSQHPPASDPTHLTAPSRDALQLIAEGVTQVAGFGVAAISVARDDCTMQVVAVAGSEEARRSLEGARTPIITLMEEIAVADDWGLLKFVPHERLDLPDGEWGWVPDIEPIDAPDAWHPLDLLVAPLSDADGVLRGMLTMDLPTDGRRPGAQQRRMLQVYAEQAGRAVVTALEREALAEQVRLAEAARAVIRHASSHLALEDVLGECQAALAQGFRAGGVWVQTFGEEHQRSAALYAAHHDVPEMDPEVSALAEAVAHRSWDAQRAFVFSVAHPDPVGLLELSAEQRRLVTDFLERIGVGSLLFVPLGAGRDCVGNLVLTRPVGDRGWTETEAAAALDVGHDLGRAVLNARTFEREHLLVQELQTLDGYKSQLIATVSHELKNPLTTVLGHLEILESVDVAPPVRTSLSAMERGARRLARVADDLLLLARMDDPTNTVQRRAVDLRSVVDDVVDLNAVSASMRELTVRVEAPNGRVVAMGDPDELDRVLTNLLSNAVKYSPDGGTIVVNLDRHADEVVLTCSDEGLGISEDDQEQLFTEFFRSSNPEAVAQPGTGLGLAIVQRIVRRHGGRIEVESELGRGSTFRVLLPAA